MSNALRAGAAKYNITPDRSIFPVFNKMNGSGGDPSIFSGVHDDIYLRAFVFENDNNRVLTLSFEWGMLDSLYGDERVFTRIAAEAAGIPAENVLNTCTHDHNCFDINFAKMLKDKYPDFYEKAVVYEKFIEEEAIPNVVKAAVANLQPAKIGFGKTQCYANVVRHDWSEDGTPTIYGFRPDRPSDKDLIVVNVKTLDDKPIGVIYNYGAHASLLANNKPDGEHTELSGDWPGYVSRKLEEKMGEGSVALFMVGGAGDQNCLIIARVYDILPDAKPVMHDFGDVGYIVLDFMSDMIAKSALEAMESITEYTDSTRIWCGKDDVVVTADYFDFEGKYNTYSGGPGWMERPAPEFEFTCLMLGDIAFAATNGEIYNQIGKRLKDDSPYKKTMFVSLAGHGLTYIKDDSGTGKAELLIRERLYRLMDKYSNEA